MLKIAPQQGPQIDIARFAKALECPQGHLSILVQPKGVSASAPDLTVFFSVRERTCSWFNYVQHPDLYSV